MAKESNPDIIFGTDPDCDRIGVVVKDNVGQYKVLTGNQTGMLLAHYMLKSLSDRNELPKNSAVIKTIVTTDGVRKIVESFGAELIDTLTGFKYIGEKIKEFEETNSNSFIFGFEESYGYLAGTYARDKDACVAVMCLCEVAAYCKSEGKTLWDMMLDMYETYGYFKEGQYTITLKGADGAKQIVEIMNKLRQNPPKMIGDAKVLRFRDYQEDRIVDMATGEETSTGLPKSNVLYFDLPNNCWCCARPSGTEPKIKFYMGIVGENLEDAIARLEKLTEDLKKEV